MMKTISKQAMSKAASSILVAVHETVDGLHRQGVVGKATMREFDGLCLAPVGILAPKDLGAIRDA